jgi:hypothetical protein
MKAFRGLKDGHWLGTNMSLDRSEHSCSSLFPHAGYLAAATCQSPGTGGMAGSFDKTAARWAGLRLCPFICGDCPANLNILFALPGGACSNPDADDWYRVPIDCR